MQKEKRRVWYFLILLVLAAIFTAAVYCATENKNESVPGEGLLVIVTDGEETGVNYG